MRYFAILGNNWQLSAAELDSVLPRYHGRLISTAAAAALFEAADDLDVERLIMGLGGTIKLGRVLTNIPTNKLTVEHLANLAKPKSSSKFHFGLSVYALSGAAPKQWTKFGGELKRHWQAMGKSVRHVTSRDPVLSSVTIAKNRLLKNGLEYCLLVDGATVYVGQTTAVQHVGEYARRDTDRPGRNAVRGMLPPKVAQMMLNFAAVTTEATILDPFCGSGTIVQEALLRGQTTVIGTDNTRRAIADATKNLAALAQQHADLTTPKLLVADARQLSTILPPKSVDAVVTEPLLGPPLKGVESPKEIIVITQALSTLYRAALANWTKILKSGAKVVIIFPIIAGRPSMTARDLKRLGQLGYTPAWSITAQTAGLLSPRQSLVYQRPGQRVTREIFVWQYKSVMKSKQ
ncbi:MAG: RsmD family RNA methyltransferase [Patescibacteria group bacterium]